MVKPRIAKSGVAVFCFVCTLVGMGIYVQTSDLPLLTPSSSGSWIVYPPVPQVYAQPRIDTRTLFEKTFQIPEGKTNASLTVRGFRRVQIEINDLRLNLPEDEHPFWKKKTTLDVSTQLHAGVNRIRVAVWNQGAPPALELLLRGREWQLVSDDTWEATYMGATRVHAAVADASLEMGPGNDMEGVGEMGTTWKKMGWIIVLGLVLSFTLYRSLCWARLKMEGHPSPLIRELHQKTVLGMYLSVALAWILLFGNNLFWLPRTLVGFDAAWHLDYIEFILKNHHLPSASDGWEMYHPPLYYFLSAVLLRIAGLNTSHEGGVELLRLLGLILGLIQSGIILGCLRLYFPNRLSLQFAGLIVGAFLPMQLYLSQYITNEMLVTVLGSAAVYQTLRMMRNHSMRMMDWLGLGCLLGFGLLTKVTGIIPFIAIGMGWLIWFRRCRISWRKSVVRMGGMLAACFLICGWHYLNLWWSYGSWLVTNVDPSSGFAHWQLPGYQTLGSYLRFGRSFEAPFFSSYHGFWDSLYSTLWGDGLLAGKCNGHLLPPWNMDWMMVCYGISILPMLLLILGFGVCLVRGVRSWESKWFIPVFLMGGMMMAFIYMSIKTPFYNTPKAFYGMITLSVLPLFFTLGYAKLSDWVPGFRNLFWPAMFLWMGSVYLSYWITPNNPVSHLLKGKEAELQGDKDQAEAEYQLSIRSDPGNSDAREQLGWMYFYEQRFQDASRCFRKNLETHPMDPHALRGLAMIDVVEGRKEEALSKMSQSVLLAPQQLGIHYQLAMIELGLGDSVAAKAAFREDLRMTPFHGQTHLDLGELYLKEGEINKAIEHLTYAVHIHPQRAEVHLQLGEAMRMDQKTQEALAEYQIVQQLDPGNQIAIQRIRDLTPSGKGE